MAATSSRLEFQGWVLKEYFTHGSLLPGLPNNKHGHATGLLTSVVVGPCPRAMAKSLAWFRGASGWDGFTATPLAIAAGRLSTSAEQLQNPGVGVSSTQF